MVTTDLARSYAQRTLTIVVLKSWDKILNDQYRRYRLSLCLITPCLDVS